MLKSQAAFAKQTRPQLPLHSPRSGRSTSPALYLISASPLSPRPRSTRTPNSARGPSWPPQGSFEACSPKPASSPGLLSS
eukprot:6436632-Pyramimonas_sp.AAC.1